MKKLIAVVVLAVATLGASSIGGNGAVSEKKAPPPNCYPVYDANGNYLTTVCLGN